MPPDEEHIQKSELHVNMQSIHKVKAINVISHELKLPTRNAEKCKRLAGTAFFPSSIALVVSTALLLSISNTEREMGRMLTLV